jgi:hypothetical protein
MWLGERSAPERRPGCRERIALAVPPEVTAVLQEMLSGRAGADRTSSHRPRLRRWFHPGCWAFVGRMHAAAMGPAMSRGSRRSLPAVCGRLRRLLEKNLEQRTAQDAAAAARAPRPAVESGSQG